MRTRIICTAVAFFLAACGGESGDSQPAGGASSPPPPQAPPTTSDISLLFMGNSHVSSNGLINLVADMVRAGRPGMTVTPVEAPGSMFLEDRLHDGPTIALLRRQNWSYVIL